MDVIKWEVTWTKVQFLDRGYDEGVTVFTVTACVFRAFEGNEKSPYKAADENLLTLCEQGKRVYTRCRF